jgi:hypothetical protein
MCRKRRNEREKEKIVENKNDVEEHNHFIYFSRTRKMADAIQTTYENLMQKVNPKWMKCLLNF